MHQPFTVGSENPITAQPTAQDSTYARSTQAADVGNITQTGVSSDIPASDTITLTGKREAVSGTDFSSFNSISLSAAQTGIVTIHQFGTAGTAPLIAETNPADGSTVTLGLIGFTQAYRFKDTLASAYDVKREATATDTMAHFKKAINADGVAGTDYFAGTSQNPYMSSVVSGTIITFTDRIPCDRYLAWSFAQSSTHFSLPSTLSGGVDGTLIATLDPGDTTVYDDLTFDTEDLGDSTLPGLVAPTTDWILVNGKACVLQLKCANISSAIALKYQTSTDAVNASDGQTSITSLDNNTVAAPRVVVPTERCIEYLRLVVTANANTTDSAVDMRVIYPIS